MLLKGMTEINANTETTDNEAGGEGTLDSRETGKIVINKEVKISNNRVSSGAVFKMEKDLWIKSKVEKTNNEVGKNVVIAKGDIKVASSSILKLNENTITRQADMTQAVMYMNEVGKNIKIDDTSSLDIVGNKIKAEIVGTEKTVVSGIYLNNNTNKIFIGNGYIKVRENQEEGTERSKKTNHF